MTPRVTVVTAVAVLIVALLLESWTSPQSILHKLRRLYQIKTIGFSYTYKNLEGKQGFLVVDFEDSAQLEEWRKIASAAKYKRATAFPGVVAGLSPAIVSSVTSKVAPLVKYYFGKNISANKFRGGFIGLSCPYADGRGPTRAASAPHVDGINPHRIVAVHYLSDRSVWPFGGGTAFFRHKETGYLDFRPSVCRREMEERPYTDYAWTCRDNMGHYNPKLEHDPSLKLVGETDDFGEYEILDMVEHKPNRIVLYRNNILHSSFVTEEGATNLSCDPNGKYRRTGIGYHWN
ncbi:hypothetical protein TL16_g00062 [Triparma laevis f. inornata]|uniref:Uncharacterized protein n=2 Tax=Triparma laevis TaxID=1534972 RepID=A0A9W7F8W6_9STRA|nr:hypothetical protein TL16_g00062 [Triparma laevis f. inornata]GMI07750.1 hypothetical protein TrLO_g11544 [Triparma laevis f. longispina]